LTTRLAGALALASLCLWSAAAGCAGRQRANPCSWQAIEPALVALERVDGRIGQDMRYAGPDNFLGRRAEGYGEPVCLLSCPAAFALAEVESGLRARGLGLLVFDCYRPQRAVEDFVRWAGQPADGQTKARYHPGVRKDRIVPEGYIAECSGHSRASTVDVTVVRYEHDGRAVPLEMGTPFDFFDPSAATDFPAIDQVARAHRDLLRSAMEAAGFRNYPKEWWHYTLENEPYPATHFDVPVSRSSAIDSCARPSS